MTQATIVMLMLTVMIVLCIAVIVFVVVTMLSARNQLKDERRNGNADVESAIAEMREIALTFDSLGREQPARGQRQKNLTRKPVAAE
jgi:biopolymer transport protein ExbB/TolQ